MSHDIDQVPAKHGLAGVYQAARLDYAEASTGDRAVLGAALTGVAFEWSTGNEALLGMTGGNLHEATDNPYITSIGTGGVSFAEQFVLGSMMAAAISRFPRVAGSLRNLTAVAREQVEDVRGPSKVGRFLSAFVLGAAVDVAIANATRERTRAENQRRVLGSAAMVGTSVAIIGGTASAALKMGAEHGFKPQAEVAVNVISSPWTYLGLFAAKLGYDRVKGWISGRRAFRAQSGASDILLQARTGRPADNAPNTLPGADFQTYRRMCDRESGLMRVGLTVPGFYDAVRADRRTEFVSRHGVTLPMIASVNPFHIPQGGEEPEVAADRSALVPLALLPHHARFNLVTTRQVLLGRDEVDQIITPSADTRLRLRDVPGLLKDKVDGDLVQGHGEPQFTVLSRYDVSECDALRLGVPSEITTRDGHTITTDKQRILASLPELVKLHEAVFRRQAARIGYYDGLVGDIIERFLSDDAFIGAAAFDKATGKPFMFALFASGLDGLDQIPWLNKEYAERLIRKGNNVENPTLALPIVITSKATGMGVFAETVSLAMNEIICRTQEKSTVHALYNANLQSVLYTPRIINAAAEQNGARLHQSLIEATVTTKLS